MTGFLIRRTLQALLVTFLVTVFTLALVAPVPRRRPIQALLGPRATPQQVAHYNQLYGFDQPFYVQYIKWAGQILHGNLGFSTKLNQSVTSLIAQDLPKTIILVVLGTAVSLLFGIPLGLYQAVKRYTAGDYVLTGDLLPRLRHPHLLHRPAAHPVVRHRHSPVPAVRPAGHHRGPDPVPAQGADPAGRRVLLRAVRAVEPVHALLGDGQPGAGLRPHRPGQGRQRAADAVGARVPELADVDHHPARALAARR